jgi:geranylgeranyl diphosphate synthase type I
MSRAAPEVIARVREPVQQALRAAVATLSDDRMRVVASYQLGWCDRDGNPARYSGGKGLRPALAVMSAQAGGGTVGDGLSGATAVELVHNFSLLHDDVMDRDVERHHRPTGWVAFGEGQAILAGNAMLTCAIEVLARDGERGRRALPHLLAAVQRLISGQSDDLFFELAAAGGVPTVSPGASGGAAAAGGVPTVSPGASGKQRHSITVDDVLRMEAGKTAALLACSASIGALAAGASPGVVTALHDYGHELGMAFQLVDDILGITGDPEVTGKSASSDVRAGKRSAPVVAALSAGTDASRRLGDLLAGGAPSTDEDVVLATKLIEEAGGVDWAAREADTRLTRALGRLDGLPAPGPVLDDLVAVARYVVDRDH